MLTDTVHLVEDSRNALQAVRSALINLYEAVGANPESPQEVARRYSINRNLTWKLSRVIGAADPFSALNHLPGQPGMELVIVAFEKAGAPDEAIESIRGAMTSLWRTVKEHAGDREHLQLTLESMGLFESDAAAASGRELAYRGNSMVWGVQAKTRVAVSMLAPSATEPGKMDFAMLSGLVGFRRLRPTAQWRLYRAQMHDDKGQALSVTGNLETIDPNPPADLPFLLREFCSPSMPEILSFDGPEGREFCLPGGQVGNRGAFDCFFGYIFRGLPAAKTPDNLYGSTAATITLPVETIVFDLLIHQDAPMPEAPELTLHGFPHGGPEDPSAQSTRNLLPMSEKLINLAGSPPSVATPHVPRLSRMVERVCERMNWDPKQFRGLRVQMKHPPMSSKMVMRWPLA